MLNHARSLLLNSTADNPPSLYYPGDELIDPAFVSLRLPSYLLAVRNQLFGADPDRYLLNYRVRQLLALTHATPLEEFLLGLDSRITYNLDSPDFVDDTLYKPVVTRTLGADPDTLNIVGQPAAPDITGRCYFVLDVEVNGTTISVTQQTTPFSKVVLDLTPNAQGSAYAPVALGGSGYSGFVSSNNSQAYRVQVVNRPQLDPAVLLNNLQTVGAANLAALFGTDQNEPYRSLRNLWKRKTELPLRLGALVVATVLRSEEVRLGTQQ